MLDILLLRKDLDTAIARLETRKKPQASLDVAAFQALESERKTLQTRTEELQAQRNLLSKQIGMLMGKGDKDGAEAAKAQVAASKVELEQSATRLEQIQSELQALLLAVPNLPHESVPVGADEHGNVEVRRWGTPAAFAFEAKIACFCPAHCGQQAEARDISVPARSHQLDTRGEQFLLGIEHIEDCAVADRIFCARPFEAEFGRLHGNLRAFDDCKGGLPARPACAGLRDHVTFGCHDLFECGRGARLSLPFQRSHAPTLEDRDADRNADRGIVGCLVDR